MSALHNLVNPTHTLKKIFATAAVSCVVGPSLLGTVAEGRLLLGMELPESHMVTIELYCQYSKDAPNLEKVWQDDLQVKVKQDATVAELRNKLKGSIAAIQERNTPIEMHDAQGLSFVFPPVLLQKWNNSDLDNAQKPLKKGKILPENSSKLWQESGILIDVDDNSKTVKDLFGEQIRVKLYASDQRPIQVIVDIPPGLRVQQDEVLLYWMLPDATIAQFREDVFKHLGWGSCYRLPTHDQPLHPKTSFRQVAQLAHEPLSQTSFPELFLEVTKLPQRTVSQKILGSVSFLV